MIMAQDGKVKPEQFQGRERPSDEFIKAIIRKTEGKRAQVLREDRMLDVIDSQNLDSLLKTHFMMEFANQNRNRTAAYEASLASAEPERDERGNIIGPSERDKLIAQNKQRDKYFGIQALTNPATRRYFQNQQDMMKYFQGIHVRLDELQQQTHHLTPYDRNLVPGGAVGPQPLGRQ